MARSVVERYLVAAFAFMAAATWFGVSLTGGFACLFVFVLASQAVRLYQRRTGLRSRRAAPRRERPCRASASIEERPISSSAASGGDRSRRSGRIYDNDGEEFGWPVASEGTW